MYVALPTYKLFCSSSGEGIHEHINMDCRKLLKRGFCLQRRWFLAEGKMFAAALPSSWVGSVIHVLGMRLQMVWIYRSHKFKSLTCHLLLNFGILTQSLALSTGISSGLEKILIKMKAWLRDGLLLYSVWHTSGWWCFLLQHPPCHFSPRRRCLADCLK